MISEGADPAADKAEARRKAAAGIDHGAMFSTAWTDWTNAPKPKRRSKKGWRPSTALRAKQDYERRLEPVWGKRRLAEDTKANKTKQKTTTRTKKKQTTTQQKHQNKQDHTTQQQHKKTPPSNNAAASG